MDTDVPFIGQIVPTAATFIPEDWAGCNGQILSIQQYQALFSLLGNNYGGTYNSGTFGLPNLNGHLTCGYGSTSAVGAPLTPGQTFGQTTILLSAANLPLHGHGVMLTLGIGVDYITGNGTLGAPPTGGLLANAVAGTAKVDIYAPVAATTSVSSILPVTLAGTPEITAGPSGGTTNISIVQPTLAMYMCIAVSGEYPINV